MHHACTFCHLEGTNFAQPRYDMIQYKHKWRGVLPNKIADQSSYHFCNFSWKFQPQRENNAVNCGHYFYLAGLLLGKHKHSASSQKLNQVCSARARLKRDWLEPVLLVLIQIFNLLGLKQHKHVWFGSKAKPNIASYSWALNSKLELIRNLRMNIDWSKCKL